jgi:hypothetical protein
VPLLAAQLTDRAFTILAALAPIAATAKTTATTASTPAYTTRVFVATSSTRCQTRGQPVALT